VKGEKKNGLKVRGSIRNSEEKKMRVGSESSFSKEKRENGGSWEEERKKESKGICGFWVFFFFWKSEIKGGEKKIQMWGKKGFRNDEIEERIMIFGEWEIEKKEDFFEAERAIFFEISGEREKFCGKKKLPIAIKK
jgi:hypothetical protein